MTADDPYDLERFRRAQEAGRSYEQAIAEIRRGRKVTHWIWWVFPQVHGLGRSATSLHYAIGSLAEARAYLADAVLGERLREATREMTARPERDARDVLGDDDVKFRSCLTLFHRAAPDERLFAEALARYFGGRPDQLTDQLLAPGLGES